MQLIKENKIIFFLFHVLIGTFLIFVMLSFYMLSQSVLRAILISTVFEFAIKVKTKLCFSSSVSFRPSSLRLRKKVFVFLQLL